MSNIAELANCPELSFIESMTLQETEEQLRELYTKYYREATGKEPEIGEADPLNLLMKAFCAMEYQTMQYADAKGRMEMLKTSTGDALDALAALVGLTRKEANRATVTVRFTLSEAQSGATAIPTGTRVKSEDGKYFNTVEYGEIAAGETYTDVVVQAEEAGADSNGILSGGIKILVDPIAYVASVSHPTPSTGGLDAEDDDSLTRRIYLAPSVYSCAGPRDAYEYYAREWRGDVADVRIVSPLPDEVNIYFVIEDENGLRVPNSTELTAMAAYLDDETIRPLCDKVTALAPDEVEYAILEQNGQISVFPKDSEKQVTLSDLNLTGDGTGLSHSVIIDGHILDYAVKNAGKSPEWVEQQLKKRHIHDIKTVFLMTVDDSDTVKIVKKER